MLADNRWMNLHAILYDPDALVSLNHDFLSFQKKNTFSTQYTSYNERFSSEGSKSLQNNSRLTSMKDFAKMIIESQHSAA